MNSGVRAAWRTAAGRDIVLAWAALATLVLGFVVVGLAWTPSHFALALAQLGFGPAGVVFGTPNGARTDDFWVATALIRSVVENHFAPVDAISPYHEPFASFVAAPIHDWSLLFKPQFWGFLLLRPAQALALYFFSFYASFLLGYTVLLRRLGVPSGFGLLVALLLLFSQLVEVWWTQRAPIFAFAPWPVLIFLSRWRLRHRVPTLIYATAAWLFGEFYPPALIATGFAAGFAVLAFARPDLRSRDGWLGLAFGLAAIGCGVAIVAFYFRDLIPVMRATIYPGQRVALGGGTPSPMILANLFPYAATIGFAPAVVDSSACDVGVVGTYLPLLLLVFGRYGSLADWLRRNRLATALWLLGLALMLAWLVLPLPAAYGALFLWTVMPIRLLWGFGLLLTIGCARIAAAIEWRFGLTRLAVFALLVLAGFAWSKGLAIEPGSPAAALEATLPLASPRLWDVAVLLAMAPIALMHIWRPRLVAPRARLMLTLAALATALLTFGRFNPIQSAKPIFTQASTPFLDAARALARANPHGWAAVPGYYGQLLNAFGVPAINHVLMAPDLPFFRRLYPDLPPDRLDATFNRYAHIQVGFDASPVVPQDDVVLLPLFDVGTPLPIDRAAAIPAGAPKGGHVDEVEPVSLGGGRWRIVVKGWAPFKGIDPAQRLMLRFSAGRILQARAARTIAVDVGALLQDHAYDTAGFAAEVEVVTDPAREVFNAGDLVLAATDAGGAVRILSR